MNLTHQLGIFCLLTSGTIGSDRLKIAVPALRTNGLPVQRDKVNAKSGRAVSTTIGQSAESSCRGEVGLSSMEKPSLIQNETKASIQQRAVHSFVQALVFGRTFLPETPNELDPSSSRPRRLQKLVIYQEANNVYGAGYVLGIVVAISTLATKGSILHWNNPCISSYFGQRRTRLFPHSRLTRMAAISR
jgi:hypothetical protein